MLLLRLFYEFAKIGLFAIGGGMATIPFLTKLASTTGWFTETDLLNMIAVSESTPAPSASTPLPMWATTLPVSRVP